MVGSVGLLALLWPRRNFRPDVARAHNAHNAFNDPYAPRVHNRDSAAGRLLASAEHQAFHDRNENPIMKTINAFTATLATGAAVAAAALLGAGTAAAAPTPGSQNGTVHAAPTGKPSHKAPHHILIGNVSGRPIEATPDRQAGFGKQHIAPAVGGPRNSTGMPMTAAVPGKGVRFSVPPYCYNAQIDLRPDVHGNSYPHNHILHISSEGVQQVPNAGHPPVAPTEVQPGGTWVFNPIPQ